jgi:hypothetical protein
MTMGRLAGHLAEIPHWTQETIDKDELDIAPPTRHRISRRR